jgi:glycogen phosphorylase
MTKIEAVPEIAYFSMEIAVHPSMPTFSGGLGVLAGDMLRSAADLELPMVAVTLLYRKGYFRQRLDKQGNQSEEPDQWEAEQSLQPTGISAKVVLEGREVDLRVWRYDIVGISGYTVPVFLLDTDLASNSQWDRELTDSLYGGDSRYRICQEVVLGMGGIAILRNLGLGDIESYHLNEGHSAFLTLALLEEQLGQVRSRLPSPKDIKAVQSRCIFTTHTPVPAGHDEFSWELVRQTLGEDTTLLLEYLGCFAGEKLNMTHLALRFSHYVNGVAMRHGEVSNEMFPRYAIHAITNGVHAGTWTSPAFQALYDCHIPDWRRDNAYLRYAVGIPLEEIQQAHRVAKRELLQEVQQQTGATLDSSVFTLGFARRAAVYKRADLLFSDPERLRVIVKNTGPLQIIYAGKAHPNNEAGKAMIRKIFEFAAQVQDDVQFVYLENYGLKLAGLMTSGVDLWLNTPQPPQEASGTSGMKAALNAVPSLSILDGWWIEGCFEGVTGWAISEDVRNEASNGGSDAESLYRKLETVIVPMFYQRPNAYSQVMRSAIALNASFFNTQRMLAQYKANAYFPEKLADTADQGPDEPDAILAAADE